MYKEKRSRKLPKATDSVFPFTCKMSINFNYIICVGALVWNFIFIMLEGFEECHCQVFVVWTLVLQLFISCGLISYHQPPPIVGYRQGNLFYPGSGSLPTLITYLHSLLLSGHIDWIRFLSTRGERKMGGISSICWREARLKMARLFVVMCYTTWLLTYCQLHTTNSHVVAGRTDLLQVSTS
jgi:hypothetical protein